ncbi:MAG: DUF1499 domain-containing protein [Deltaproteobacteria bacterium]|nr:DUF1499 domain-containing protein [Deltaproteobacteria bacterium]MBW2448319.1 DUF1499 domain-containing protein [Deltaproteobacteria bacterium]
MPERRALSATIAQGLGILAIIAVVVGAVAGNQEWMPGEIGFRVFGLGLLLGIVTLLLGLIGIARTGPGSGRTGRDRAKQGALVGAALTVVLFALAAPGRNLPAINDITTDIENPPAFEAAGQEAANRGRDLGYPGESFAAQQRLGYPDLAPLQRSSDPGSTYDSALAAAKKLGWTVIADDRSRLRFEAYEVTSFFHFVDDVVVRIRIDGAGSIVDVRSKSRDGKGDIGANAARIRAFFAELEASS